MPDGQLALSVLHVVEQLEISGSATSKPLCLFVQINRLCQKAGLGKFGHVALDGTRIKTTASKHKAISYGYSGR